MNHDWTPSQFLDTRAVGRAMKSIHEYSLGEEVANSITHGIGVLLAIAAIPLCVVQALNSNEPLHLLAALLYSIFMLLEYVMSTLYHALSADRAKRVFKVLDHSFIYLFIAATYTPYCLITLVDSVGVGLCVFVWAVALVGVAVEAFWVFHPPLGVCGPLSLFRMGSCCFHSAALCSVGSCCLLAAFSWRFVLFNRMYFLRIKENTLYAFNFSSLDTRRIYLPVFIHRFICFVALYFPEQRFINESYFLIRMGRKWENYVSKL